MWYVVWAIQRKKLFDIRNIKIIKWKYQTKNTIERLCDNLQSLDKEEVKIIKNNYLKEVKKYFLEEAISIFDDRDIFKRYGKKFEDLDEVIDVSDKDKRIGKGYSCMWSSNTR